MKLRNLATAVCLLVLIALLLTPFNAAADEPAPDDRSGLLSSSSLLPLIARAAQPAAPIIHSFTANPATIVSGGASTLSWQVTGATSLSITPGVGTVSGSSVTVSPAATTQYTLHAVNASGTTTAPATVTVNAAPPATGGFFLFPTPDIELPTSHPTMAVDPSGGVHVAFTPESATQGNPARPAYYAYCPANCTSAAAFTRVQVGDGVDSASLALTPAGQPRLLVRKPVQSVYVFQYLQCNSNCTNLAQWQSGDLGYAYARPVGWVEGFIPSFALDHLGRPRFVYYDNGSDYQDPHRGAFYAWCDANCASPANWYETRLLDDSHASEFDLAFGPNGQPRLVYATYDSQDIAQQAAYAECQQNCHSGGNWSGIVLANTASASVSHDAKFSLAVDSTGKPRLALYTGTGIGGSLAPNSLYYLACDAAQCAAGQAWSALRLNLPQTQGEEGVALALDSQNRPRIAFHAPLAAGFGLHFAWCNASCATSAQAWQAQEVEASEEVNAELPIPPWPGCPFPQCNPPVPPCTMSSWDSGVRPALALDGAGNPRIAYDAEHLQGGACGTFTDTKLTRFIQFNRP
jgi:hypothetical protein